MRQNTHVLILAILLSTIFSGCAKKPVISGVAVDTGRENMVFILITDRPQNHPRSVEYKIVDDTVDGELRMRSIVVKTKNKNSTSMDMIEIPTDVTDEYRFSFTIPIKRIAKIPVKVFFDEMLVATVEAELDEPLLQMAIQKFNEVNGPDHHLKYAIGVKETPEEWIVRFESKSPPIKGDHMVVTINKETGEVEYFQGE